MPTASKKSSKVRHQRKHFSRRCKERLGVNLDPKDIARKIQNNKLKFIKRKSNRITVWEYEYESVVYLIFYDSLRSTPVTIYPRHDPNPLISHKKKAPEQ